jgi:hypothetical protein
MKYLLLLILPLLSNAVVIEINASPLMPAGVNYCSSNVEAQLAKVVSNTDSLVHIEDYLREMFPDIFVVSSRDTFPIQVGAFKNKANAEKIAKGMVNLSNIKVRIVLEDELYKVRISRIPGVARIDTNQNKAPVQSPPSVLIAMATKDTTEDTSHFTQLAYHPGAVIDTPETAADTVYRDGEIIFFDANSPWLKRIKYFGESFMFVNALIITILISIISMITLLIVILMNRRRMEKEEKLRQYLMEKYQSLIVDYLFGSATTQEFRAIALDDYSRQVLIEQMIDVSVNLKGEESDKLYSLYKQLGLEKDSLARARNYRWHKKIKGFRELAYMNIKDANDVIYKALDSSNEILRMEAQIALVRLSDKDHFEFLTRLKRPFSLWEQITLHDLIIQHNIPVPAFKQWVTSANDTVAVFALRMIKEFKQTDAEEEIKKALLHNSPAIRLVAVQVAGDLGMKSTLENLKHMYKNQDYKTCLEIVKSMGKMPDTSMLGFLKLVLDKEDDVQLQIEATKSIEKMGEEGIKALVKIMKSEYKNYNIIVRHVLDRRIN